MSYLHDAFHAVCKEAKTPTGFYVSLMVNESRYGGPEEGGWWTTDSCIVAYQYYPTEEQARAAKAEAEKFANELENESRQEFGKQCLRELDWCEARGLDADFLPEPDGPDSYYVLVTESLPQESYGPTHYE